MNLREEFNNAVQLLKNTIFVLTVLSVIITSIWTLAKKPVQESIREFLGVPELYAAVANLRVDLNQLREQVEIITPPIIIVEWDIESSFLIGECNIGGNICQINLRAKRTPEGLHCAAPTKVEMFVQDAAGDIYRVQPTPGWEIIRLGPRYENFIIEFRSPLTGEPGRAFFFAINTYTGCRFPKDPEPIRKTPNIPFELGADTNSPQ